VLTARVLTGLLAVAVALSSGRLAAQTPSKPQESPQPPPAADPLGRETPRGTVTGFNVAVHRNDLTLAARYLDLRGRQPRTAESLARDLNDLIDRYFIDSLASLASTPAGMLDDGLPPDRERLMLTIGGESVPIFLSRVNERGTGLVWLIASDSLAQVPALHDAQAATVVERMMPGALVARQFLGISVAQWILWAASLALPFVAFWAAARPAFFVFKRTAGDPTRRALIESSWKSLRWLIVLSLALLTHLVLVRYLGFSLTFRLTYLRTALVVVVILVTLLAWRLVAVTFSHARMRAVRRGRSNTRSLMLLGERVLKVGVVLVAVLAVLSLAGVDTTAALAGLGIGGVALALGAQKSIDNLLGAVTLLSDRALAVGDFCRVSNRVGWVEDVTLRSVRLRTLDQTLLSIPAGMLSQDSIENFATRSKILMQTTLRLRYGTSVDQVQEILDRIRHVLADHPQIIKDDARIRLTNFGAEAIELELFAYVNTPDFAEFLSIRESLLLQIAGIVESAGSEFARPTQFIHMSPGAAHDETPVAAR
jgi:MscS family membrane protein